MISHIKMKLYTAYIKQVTTLLVIYCNMTEMIWDKMLK